MKHSILIFLMSLILSISVYAVNNTTTFTDVPENAWYKEAADYVIKNEIMTTPVETKFFPDQPISTNQVNVILHYLIHNTSEAIKCQCLSDTVPSMPAFSAESGIVTRQQLAIMLATFEKNYQLNFKTLSNKSSNKKGSTKDSLAESFKDSWSIPPQAQESVRRVNQVGLMNGDSQNNFGPKTVVTRAEAAVIFMRLHQLMLDVSLKVSKIDNTIDASLSTTQKDAQARAIAQSIVRFIPTEGLSDVERVQLAVSIVNKYCPYSTYTIEHKNNTTAYDFFVNGECSYSGVTRAMGLVLECMGFEWKHVNENEWTKNQWCQLTMDGKIGYADAMIGRAGYGNHTTL